MNFAGLPNKYTEYDKARAVILPIPYDNTSTWMKGADKGPQAILEASVHLEYYDIETKSEPYRQGICTLAPMDCPPQPEDMVAAVHKKALQLFQDNKLVVGLGGEHSVSIGLIRAAREKYRDLSVLQFDAHSDLRDAYEGSNCNHACVMARVREICPFVQIGIRSMDISELERIDRDRLVTARDIHYHGINAAADALDLLSDNVYITIDVDALDPAFMPSTGTPEPGGLDWYMLIDLITRAAREKNIVGFDVVELLPNKHNRAPDFLAAKLVYRTLSVIFNKS